jgi:hypothetical protein
LPRLDLSSPSTTARGALPRTTTNAEGKYAFFGLEAGEHRVIVTHPDYLPSRDAVVLVPARAPLAATSSCERAVDLGRVVNAQGYRSLAFKSLLAKRKSCRHGFQRQASYSRPGRKLASSTNHRLP